MRLPGPKGRKPPRIPMRQRGSVRFGDARVGQFYASAAQVRAELDRVNNRWQSLKRAVSTLEAEDATRIEFGSAWRAWRAFYEDARGDWLAWGSNVAEANRYDQEADAWRTRLAALGLEVANPTTSSTVREPSSGWPTANQVLLGLGLVAAGLYFYSTRNSGGAP